MNVLLPNAVVFEGLWSLIYGSFYYFGELITPSGKLCSIFSRAVVSPTPSCSHKGGGVTPTMVARRFCFDRIGIVQNFFQDIRRHYTGRSMENGF